MRGSLSTRSNVDDRSNRGGRAGTYRGADRRFPSSVVPVLALGVPLLAVLGIASSVAPVFVTVIAAIAAVATLSVIVPRGLLRVADVLEERVGSTRHPDRTGDEPKRASDVGRSAD